jgi:hypothetical protein
VLETRQATHIGNQRWRVCPNNHRFYTHELTTDLLKRMVKDILMEPGFFSREEKELERSFRRLIGKKLTMEELMDNGDL